MRSIVCVVSQHSQLRGATSEPALYLRCGPADYLKMSIPELIGQGPSPSKFGPGFGAKTRSLRFFTGHEDRRYPFPGELGMNEHLKGRFGAELSIMLPSGFGVESSPLAASQRNRASLSAWLQPPHRSAHPGFSMAAADYAMPAVPALTRSSNDAIAPWAEQMTLTTSQRGLARLLRQRLHEDYGDGDNRFRGGTYEVQTERLQNKPRSEQMTRLGPGFGSPSPPRFPPIKDSAFGVVRRPVRRVQGLASSQSAPNV